MSGLTWQWWAVTGTAVFARAIVHGHRWLRSRARTRRQAELLLMFAPPGPALRDAQGGRE